MTLIVYLFLEKNHHYYFIIFFVLGYLDPSNDDNTLQPGTKLELPYWLARSLCTNRRQIVTVELPKAYRENYRQVFKADPNVVDLHKLGPYFYNFGSHLLAFQHPDSASVAVSMLKVRETLVLFFAHLPGLCD
jgi:GINS complex subunit 3